MKYFYLVLLGMLCSGCGGNIWLTPNGHRLFYQSRDQQFSCYGSSCCYPWKEKVMICTEAVDINSGSVIIKYVPDK